MSVDVRTVHLQFLLQSDEDGNSLGSFSVPETEAAAGNTITFGEIIKGTTAGSPTIPLIVTLKSDIETVPEPSTGVLAVIACGLMWALKRRFK
jgi:hypothetical protein